MSKRALDFAVDVVAAMTSSDVDIVAEIYGSGHERYCDYKPYIREDGFIWCDTCEVMIAGRVIEPRSIHNAD
jgi:hypothetical protein